MKRFKKAFQNWFYKYCAFYAGCIDEMNIIESVIHEYNARRITNKVLIKLLAGGACDNWYYENCKEFYLIRCKNAKEALAISRSITEKTNGIYYERPDLLI